MTDGLKELKSDILKWYVIHTYSGYENKVKGTLDNIIETRNIRELISDVIVPTYETIENKAGAKKSVQRKTLPSYVLVKMVMNDYTWYIVRNVRGVTGFVGPGSKPVALTEKEVMDLGLERIEVILPVDIGDLAKITTGAFASSSGVVTAINKNKKTVTVNLNVFGRETPVEIDFASVEKI